ncbi:MAG: hypothetical protein RL660_2945 [Bacteroidota bacterium]|jgi:hypothetical protein
MEAPEPKAKVQNPTAEIKAKYAAFIKDFLKAKYKIN